MKVVQRLVLVTRSRYHVICVMKPQRMLGYQGFIAPSMLRMSMSTQPRYPNT
jgi:hypothetical protein